MPNENVAPLLMRELARLLEGEALLEKLWREVRLRVEIESTLALQIDNHLGINEDD